VSIREQEEVAEKLVYLRPLLTCPPFVLVKASKLSTGKCSAVASMIGLYLDGRATVRAPLSAAPRSVSGAAYVSIRQHTSAYVSIR